MNGKREITVIEAGMIETIKQLEKDKAELVEALDTILTSIDNGSSNIIISVEIARDTYQKHGSNQ